jgi:DNA-binding NarL/FixJ family response regulator
MAGAGEQREPCATYDQTHAASFFPLAAGIARWPPTFRGSAMISVCLVDDQNLVRQGVRSLLDLAEDIRVVAECADGAQAVQDIPRVKPDVVLLDLRMPNMSGLEVLQALSARNELPPTIILTTFDDDQLVLQGLKAGARGYLLKDVSLEQLVEAVRTVAAGGSLVAPMVTQRLLAGVGRMQNQFTSLEQPDPLTERETEILRLLSGGYSNKEIANSLKVAEGTVKNHVSNILSKLGVRDRTRAVLKALELGIV